MSGTENLEKQKAMDLAEDSRQTEWTDPSFVAELFRGNFPWGLVHPFPLQSAEDKKIGDDYIEKIRGVLEAHIDPSAVDRSGELPTSAVKALAEADVFGMKIPKEYGGLGLSQTNYNRVVGFIGSYCASTGVWVSAHQSIGVPQPLKDFGTEEQKKKYLPRFAAGEVSAFALTEPDVGSDPAKMKTTATPSDDGSYYLINGEKLWCTNGPAADILVVMAVTPPKIVKGKERTQITAFIVEADSPGYEIAHVCSFMGIRGIRNGLLRFTNVKVPKENIIGEPGMGLRIALTTLNTGRLTVPSTASAMGKVSMHFSKDWCKERVQWGAPIGKHQAVAKMVAQMTADTFAMESMTWLSCAMADRGGTDIRLEAAMAKYYTTEVSWRIADDFVQVRGGRGFETAESLGQRGEKPIAAERMLRDGRIARIIEGTSEIMRLFIAREAFDTHFRLVMPIMLGKGKKGPLLWKAFKFYALWYPKLWFPASVSFNVKHLNSSNQAHLRSLPKTAKKLARTLFHTMGKYKQKLEREQIIMQAFVDIGTDLFAMAATLSHAEALLAEGAADGDIQEMVDLYCRDARKRIAQNFHDVKSGNHHNGMYTKVANGLLDGQYEWMVQDVYTDIPPSLRNMEPQTPYAPKAKPAPEEVPTK
jgi:hypothetical protein